jgi:hypothetical protein
MGKKKEPCIPKIGLWTLRIPIETDKAADFFENAEFVELQRREIIATLAGCLIVET